MKIGIITAMSSEQKQVAQLLENKKEYTEGPFQYTEGSIRNNTIILMKCGIGKVNAAAGTVELIRTFQPDCVISTGVAGGIDSCLKIMDVVVSRQIVYHDVWCGEGNMYGQIQGLPARFEGNATLFDCAMSLDTPTAIHGGLICSGDKFITDRSELNDIKEKFHEGLAVDMESGASPKSAAVAIPKRISAPKRTACFFKSSINSGPVIPSGYPGKFSTSVVVVNCPPGCIPS